MQHTPVKNKYSALEEAASSTDGDDNLAVLNTWAHKVTMKAKGTKGKTPKRKIPMNVIIQNEKKFDKVISEFCWEDGTGEVKCSEKVATMANISMSKSSTLATSSLLLIPAPGSMASMRRM